MSRRSVFDRPVHELAEDLLAVGRGDLHHRLIEALADDPLTALHVDAVQDRLVEEMVTDRRVAERDRQRARDLIAVGDDMFAAIGRCGVVSIFWSRAGVERGRPAPVSEAEGVYLAHRGDEETFEASPEFAIAAEALARARRRAPWVTIRPWWDDGTRYRAGDGPAPDGLPGLDARR